MPMVLTLTLVRIEVYKQANDDACQAVRVLLIYFDFVSQQVATLK
jgi:hypothetical protein